MSGSLAAALLARSDDARQVDGLAIVADRQLCVAALAALLLRDGRYALLTDEQAGKGVYLDDQEKAKAFEGKNVKVTGVLEVAKNLVHVTDIQPA